MYHHNLVFRHIHNEKLQNVSQEAGFDLFRKLVDIDYLNQLDSETIIASSYILRKRLRRFVPL